MSIKKTISAKHKIINNKILKLAETGACENNRNWLVRAKGLPHTDW